MSNHSDQFQYDDLSEVDSIRLLILHPGTLGSPIQSDLIHTTLCECRCDIHGNYTALSYVWGDASDTTDIFVDGLRFAVTVNLAAALHDLRDEKRQLRLWADAICINQTNNIERSQQVGLMKEVYSYAQTTVIYLGALVEQTKSLFELMNQLDPDRIKLLDTADDAIKDIVSRPWFTRVWVYQELVLSNIVFVQLGRMRVPWDYLCEVMLYTDRDRRDRNDPPKDRVMPSMPTLDLYEGRDSDTESRTSEPSSIGPAMREREHGHDTQDQPLWAMYEARRNYQNRLRYGSREIDFLDVLGSRRGSGASDLRDMIYGHLAVVDIQLERAHESYDGLATWPKIRNWSLQENIPVVDYTKSVEVVFTEAARFTSSFRSVDSLTNLLYHADVKAPYTRRSGLPSWVPDWTLDKNSLQGLPWIFDDTDIRSTPGVTQAETWSLISGDGGFVKTFYMSPIPVIPLFHHILSFFYWGCDYKLEVVEKVAQIAVVNELAYESARQKLIKSAKEMIKRRGSLLRTDVFRPIHSLWQSLGATHIYPIPPKDLPREPDIPASDWLNRLVRNSREPDPKFIVNISTVALKSKGSLDIFRGMKFARFRSGRVGVVPIATEPGDFTLTDKKDGYRDCQNCCMFRPKEDHKDEAYNLDIRAEIDTGAEKVIPVQHCTYLGKAWVESSPSWESYEDERADFLSLKIIAIH